MPINPDAVGLEGQPVRRSWTSKDALIYALGVGAGVAVVGALTGALIPLAAETADAGRGEFLDAILIFVGVASSLIYFQYLARRNTDGQIERPRSLKAISAVGQGFIIVTLGAVYAAAIITSLTIFSERLAFLLGMMDRL